jgi:hypothetical protein
LAADSGLGCQFAGSRAVFAEVAKHGVVAGLNLVEALVGQSRLDFRIHDGDSVAEQ